MGSDNSKEEQLKEYSIKTKELEVKREYEERQRREAENVQREIAAQKALRERELEEMRQKRERERREREAEQERERLKVKDQEDKLKALEAKQRADMLEREQNYQRDLRERERLFQEELKERELKLMALEAEKQAALDRKLKEPWRQFEKKGDWTSTYHDHLIELIKRHQHYGELKDARVLFLGPIRAGKSSFINSVASIDKGRIAKASLAGASAKSMTIKLKQYKPKNILQNFRLLDTMGVEDAEGEGFNVQDVKYVINGNVRPDYKFDQRSPIDVSDEKNFKKKPTMKDKCHCIVVVMDSLVIDSDSISNDAKKKIKILQDDVQSKDVPTILVLTKIDELCEEVHTDIKNTYHSRKVSEVVKQAENLFGVQKMDIFPVKNYSSEQELDIEKNILILLALRKMMEYCSDRLESLEDQQESESENSD